jgi:2,4-didehydro-3-deoxy-L-rhamnonate hydrolase
MKLVRYGNPGKEKPGLIDAQGVLRNLSSVVPDIGAAQLGSTALAKLAQLKTDKLPAVKGRPRMACPVANVGKFIAPAASWGRMMMSCCPKARLKPTGKLSWVS